MVSKSFCFPRRFWKKHLILVLILFAGQLAPLTAETFERAEVVKAINLVSLLPQATRAVPGDVVTGNTGVKTGNDSRAELQFPDLTITRVGANSLFRFITGTREMILDGGTMLFSAPAGTGGGKVQAGAITAAVTGTDFMISNVGRVKVICLSHKVTVYLTANPKIRAELRPGQMLDIAPGMDRKMPRPMTINLGKLLTTSKLSEAGGFRPLPSQAILAQNTNRQAKAFSLAKADLTSESAEEVRATTDFASNTSSQSRQAAAAQTTRDTEEATSASSPVNNGNPGNSGNNENRRNSGNVENRGNSGNVENRGNSANNGNPGNSGNNGNPGNSGNNGNPDNSGNNGNRGNNGSNENRGNRGNIENRGNSGRQGA
jgi:FecR protein